VPLTAADFEAMYEALSKLTATESVSLFPKNMSRADFAELFKKLRRKRLLKVTIVPGVIFLRLKQGRVLVVERPRQQ